VKISISYLCGWILVERDWIELSVIDGHKIDRVKKLKDYLLQHQKSSTASKSKGRQKDNTKYLLKPFPSFRRHYKRKRENFSLLSRALIWP